MLPPDIVRHHLRPGAVERRPRGRAASTSRRAPPQSGSAALDYPGVNLDVDNVVAQLTFALPANAGSADAGGALTSTTSGPLAPGDSRIFTGTFVAPPMTAFPRFAGETEAEYRNRLVLRVGRIPRRGVAVDGPRDAGQSAAARRPSCNLPIELPLLVGAQKTGPATVNAGFASPYTVTLPNSGNGAASAITLTDSVDGQPVTIANLSRALDGRRGEHTAPPRSRRARRSTGPAGPMTDVATLTWQDRNGNVYGPITASFTGSVAPGPPGGLPVAGDRGDRHPRPRRRRRRR